jgi:hypothetical protein
MKRYSDSEVDLLIDDISQAAYEAIEQAASEAARAAALAALEREALLLQARAAALKEAARMEAEVQRLRFEAELRQQVIDETKKAGRKNTLIGTLIGVFGGLVAGIGSTLIIIGR